MHYLNTQGTSDYSALEGLVFLYLTAVILQLTLNEGERNIFNVFGESNKDVLQQISRNRDPGGGF